MARGRPARAERWLATVVSLPEHQLKVGYARSELYGAELADASEAIDQICQLAEQARSDARDVLAALVPTIVDDSHITLISSIRATAKLSAHWAAARLLRCSTPEGFGEAVGQSGSQILQRADGRPLTLGERRALARRPSRTMLDKLAKDPHPMVARILLTNPRIREQDVVLMAARRPAAPAVTIEVAKAWSRSARVRNALVLNRTAPTAVTVPLLYLMLRPELAHVSRAADLLPVVRSTAYELMRLRPPLEKEETPELIH